MIRIEEGQFFVGRTPAAAWIGSEYVSDPFELLEALPTGSAHVDFWTLRPPTEDERRIKAAVESVGMSVAIRFGVTFWGPRLDGPEHEADALGPLGCFTPSRWPLAKHPRSQYWVNKGPIAGVVAEILRALNRVSPSGVELVAHWDLSILPLREWLAGRETKVRKKRK